MSDLHDYIALYDGYCDAMIRWSEGDPQLGIEGVLRPRYLHLHEADIGNVKHYSMKSYLAGFIRLLGESAMMFRRITFCHSYEQTSRQEPEKCKREKFYYYVWDNPGERETTVADIKFPTLDGGLRGEEMGRMDPISIEPNLGQLLLGTDMLQTYILGCTRKDIFQYHNELMKSTPEHIEAALSKFRQAEWGGYQFTIHGYSLADSNLNFGRAHVAFLRLVFLMHVITWNFDLRSTDVTRHSIVEPLGQMKAAFRQWKIQGEAFHASAAKMISQIEVMADTPTGTTATLRDAPTLILPCDEEVLALFRDPHDLSMLWANGPAEHFPSFWRKLSQLSRNISSSLTAFGKECGANSLLHGPENVEADHRNTWAAGIWLAMKLLTRRLYDPRGNVALGPDQCLLSLLKGLSHRSIPVRVRYIGRGFETMDEFCKSCSIGRDSAAGPGAIWSVTNWLSTPLGDKKHVCIFDWKHPGGDTTPVNPTGSSLVAALQSGLLRRQENVELLSLLRVPLQSKESPDASAHFLGNLSKLVSELARAEGEDRILQRTAFTYELTQRSRFKRKRLSARARLKLVCRAKNVMLKNLKTRNIGELNTAWWKLLETLKQDRPLLDDGRWRTGLAVSKKNQDVIVFTIMLESDREAFSL